MRYALTRNIVSSQQQLIRLYGDILWHWVSSHAIDGEPFGINFVADSPVLGGLAPRTRTDIARCVMANVIAEYADTPDECPIVRIGNRWMQR